MSEGGMQKYNAVYALKEKEL